MKLQAIGLGENPQAFINDILLAVADKMIVSDGTEMYECEVIEISQNTVLVRCRGVGIRLKLVETVDGDGCSIPQGIAQWDQIYGSRIMKEERNLNSRAATTRSLFVWALVLVAMAAIAVGSANEAPAEFVGSQDIMVGSEETTVGSEDATVGSEADVPGSSDTAGAAASSSTAAETVTPGGKIQSIAFKKDMRIQDALQFLAARYKKNIVPSSKVDGAITLTNLYDVTFDQALEAILGYGFKYEEKGNFINVYTAEEYKKIKEDVDRMVYEVFTVYYTSAFEAKHLGLRGKKADYADSKRQQQGRSHNCRRNHLPNR